MKANSSNSLSSINRKQSHDKENEKTQSSSNEWYSESGSNTISSGSSHTDEGINKSSNWSLGTDVSTNPPLLEDMGLSPLQESVDKEKNNSNTKSHKNSLKRTQKVLHPSSQENQNYAAIFIQNNKNSEEFFVYKRRKLDSVGGEDMFNRLTDEMLLEIFKFLPKFMLTRCAQVSKRFKRISFDETLWRRLDLGAKTLDPGVVGRVLLRGSHILRLAKAEIGSPIFCPQLQHLQYPDIKVKLQLLDLSMAAISIQALEELLSTCVNLRKVSLEHCTVSHTCMEALSKNNRLDTLNLAMCYGLDYQGLMHILTRCNSLLSLNIAWTHLDSRDLSMICKNFPSSLQRLNISGCRNTLTDSHINQLTRCCSQLQELDVSDASHLTSESVKRIMNKLENLEYLSFARCFGITPEAYLDLRRMSSLMYLDVYGVLADQALSMLKESLQDIKINKYLFSSVARPTVGIRRTSIWNMRVRD